MNVGCLQDPKGYEIGVLGSLDHLTKSLDTPLRRQALRAKYVLAWK